MLALSFIDAHIQNQRFPLEPFACLCHNARDDKQDRTFDRSVPARGARVEFCPWP